MNAPRLAVVPALAAVLVLVTGCASDLSDARAQKSSGQLAVAGGPSTAEPLPSTPEPSSPSALPPASGPPTPVGGPDSPAHRVESSGVSFEVPKGWLELKASDIAAGPG